VSPRAVLVSPDPGGRGGGVEHFVGLIADLLADHGWDVGEVGPDWEAGRLAPRLGLSPLRWTRSAMAKIVPAPDLVVSNGLLGGLGPRAARTRRVHVYHGTMVEHVLRGERNLPPVERFRHAFGSGLAEWAAGRHATTVAVSDHVAWEVARYYRRRVDAVIPNAVDVTRFGPRDRGEARARLGLPAEARIALFAGRIERRKGSDLLLPACDAAGYELAVAGAIAPERGHYLGALGHDELPWAYAAADVVLFPTRYEGFSFVVLEALASERLLVTTPVGFAPTLAREVPAYAPFVVEADVGALAAALRTAVRDDHAAAVAGAAAYVREHLTLERFRERWAELLGL
jgi:glycosyltransferase involved in cell wall biosynthesis